MADYQNIQAAGGEAELFSKTVVNMAFLWLFLKYYFKLGILSRVITT